ncbi:ELM1/GtrOC1 family putative glycosyltransferase [Pseudoalteromonas fenneropenaei]|uniref:ELM1/GtrOC1 family putative glycosyltransferase n=1 Tax=Pseudoalteromonas fenneropenaei TaxID=1737459 RepID=A0ABV7CN61_9GAMM
MAYTAGTVTRVWITKTTRDGDTNARIGIAERITRDFAEIEVPTEFCTLVEAKQRLVTAGLISADQPQWPEVIIGPCFHIPYMQLIKVLSEGKTVVVALRPPVRGLPIKASKEDVANTDIIVSYPYHDNAGLPNLLLCDTVPNRISAAMLLQQKSLWGGYFQDIAQHRPLVGLLVGGDIGDKRKVFTIDAAQTLASHVSRLVKELGGALFITTSARTSAELQRTLCTSLSVPFEFYDPKIAQSANPYLGLLACADVLVVTADSMSMCSEAVSSHKPVYVFYEPAIVEDKHALVAEQLLSSGSLQILDNHTRADKFAAKYGSHAQQNSSDVIAHAVKSKLAEKAQNTQSANLMAAI